MIVSLDGELVDAQNASVSIHDRGFLFADGVFETALFRYGGFLRLRSHLERFAASARTMHLDAPPLEDIDAMIRDVVRANDLEEASIRVTLTRGTDRPTLLITAHPPDARWVDRARAGWHIITAETRRPSTAAVPAQLKALGRTYALLARGEASIAGVDDALLLTDAGDVCEGPSWNVFWRTGNTLCTPDLDAGVLAGVTRSALLELAPEEGFSVEEGFYPRAALDSADEIFATMTSVGIVPIRSLDHHPLPPATPAADRLLVAYAACVAAECAKDPL